MQKCTESEETKSEAEVREDSIASKKGNKNKDKKDDPIFGNVEFDKLYKRPNFIIHVMFSVITLRAVK